MEYLKSSHKCHKLLLVLDTFDLELCQTDTNCGTSQHLIPHLLVEWNLAEAINHTSSVCVIKN